MKILYKLHSLFTRSTPANSYYSDNLDSKYKNLGIFTQVLNDINAKEIKTDATIAYSNDIDFNSSIFRVLLKLGIPAQWAQPRLFSNYDVLMYKTSIYQLRFHNEFHFLNGKLIYFSHGFPYINTDHNAIVEKLLREKYIPEHRELKDLSTVRIVDGNGNFIYTRNQGQLSINYMTGDQDAQQKLLEMSKHHKKLKSWKRSKLEKVVLEKI